MMYLKRYRDSENTITLMYQEGKYILVYQSKNGKEIVEEFTSKLSALKRYNNIVKRLIKQ